MAAMPLEQVSNRMPSIAYLFRIIVMGLSWKCLNLVGSTRCLLSAKGAKLTLLRFGNVTVTESG